MLELKAREQLPARLRLGTRLPRPLSPPNKERKAQEHEVGGGDQASCAGAAAA
jgi:hypothetical protein